MRRYLFLLTMTINFLVDMPLLVIVFIISLFSKKTSRAMAYKINRFTGLLMLWCSGAPFDAKGLENINDTDHCVYIANHKSMLDIPVMAKYIKRPVIFIAKDGVEKWPILGWWVKVQGTLFIDRKSPKEGMKALRKGIEMIKSGDSMVIFPEGTRSKNEDLLPFKKGSIRIAEKAGVPIVPCAIKGTADVFENNGFNLKKRTIHFIAGEPIDLKEVQLKEGQSATEYVQDVIQSLYDSL